MTERCKMALTNFNEWREKDEVLNEDIAGSIKDFTKKGRSLVGGVIGRLGAKVGSAIAGKVRDISNPAELDSLAGTVAGYISTLLSHLPEEQKTEDNMEKVINALRNKIPNMLKKNVQSITPPTP